MNFVASGVLSAVKLWKNSNFLLSALFHQVVQQGWCLGSPVLLEKAWLLLLWIKNFSRNGERKWVGSQKTLVTAWPREEKACYGYELEVEGMMCQLLIHAWKLYASKFDNVFFISSWTKQKRQTGSWFIGDSV